MVKTEAEPAFVFAHGRYGKGGFRASEWSHFHCLWLGHKDQEELPRICGIWMTAFLEVLNVY